MSALETFSDVIGLWPSAAEFGRDINVKEVTARAWKARGIPAEYWTDIESSASARGYSGVTVSLLAAIAAREAGRGLVSDQPAQERVA